jgi:ribosomal protein S18 acetylase RimI-like enzyme
MKEGPLHVDCLNGKKKKERTYDRQRDLVRLATDDDLGFIRELSSEAFSTFGDYSDVIELWFSNSDVITVTYVHNGQDPLGFGLVSVITGEILAIAVAPKYQRRGIGSALLNYIEFLATQRGLSMLLLHTAKENKGAQLFFQEAGFQLIGTHKDYYPKGQTAFIMSKQTVARIPFPLV